MRIQEHPLLGQGDRYIDKWEAFFAGLIEGGLSWAFDACGHHYLNLSAMVLNARECRAMEEAHGRVVVLYNEMLALVRKFPELLCDLGIPEPLHRLCLRDDIAALTAYGRFDWMVGADGEPKLLEFNAETPGGILEATSAQRLITCEYPGFLDPNADTASRVLDSLANSVTVQGGNSLSSPVAVIGFLDDPEERAILHYIAQAYGNSFVGDIRTLEVGPEGATVGGRWAELIYSHYSVEWMAKDRGGAAMMAALESGVVRLVNPPKTLIAHSKALPAVAWIARDRLSAAAQEAIDRHLPRTAFEREALMDSITFEKPLHGREGRGIRKLEPREPGSSGFGDVVYQEGVSVTALEFPTVRNGRVVREPLFPTIGTFCIARQPGVMGEFGGYFTRLGPDVIGAANVRWVPTLVEK
ncbi:glutathionylspermidine synthase family protein [Heliophilum fasciatum]|uniref:Glutathionylspermidine synthase n=1 Tax=Heliophilum fasciatum TaxID=35700 RepID=A0A4R2RMV1_9FIRM|nr:glutathionylspermidine synthase family protein [Heliophilum fasciatum]MCW2278190.1 glutathionylspermidine synthase [Heliophilum fasciatum]TCP63989.1 glutathionylspermidine synthase [Heliophilum fasciatum]